MSTVTLPLKSSRNEQRAIRFSCGQNNLMQMRFTRIYTATSVFSKPAIHVWCKQMLGRQKFASDTKVQ